MPRYVPPEKRVVRRNISWPPVYEERLAAIAAAIGCAPSEIIRRLVDAKYSQLRLAPVTADGEQP